MILSAQTSKRKMTKANAAQAVPGALVVVEGYYGMIKAVEETLTLVDKKTRRALTVTLRRPLYVVELDYTRARVRCIDGVLENFSPEQNPVKLFADEFTVLDSRRPEVRPTRRVGRPLKTSAPLFGNTVDRLRRNVVAKSLLPTLSGLLTPRRPRKESPK